MIKLVKRIGHFIFVVGASIPWLVGVIFFWLALLMVIAADKLWPNADMGNCWSFVGPKWAKYGGYMLVRPADGVRAIGFGKVPHVIWVKKLTADVLLQQSAPLDRYTGKWLLWRKFYFKHNIIDTENSHDAT